MTSRRVRFLLLLLAMLVVFTAIELFRRSATIAPLPYADRGQPTPRFTSRDEAKKADTSSDLGVATDGSSDASQLHADVRRALSGQRVRPNEALLTFANAEAYRRFLDRAQHHGLTVLGQLDALLTVRVRYDALANIEADLRENAPDYAHVGGNPYVNVPRKPAVESRQPTNEVPFGNTALGFLGVTADHESWGRGVRIAVLDTGVAPDPTLGISRISYLDIGLGTLPGHGIEDGHGTSVASLAAGSAIDAPGIAPAATVVSIRVTDATGRSDIFTVAQAILAAADAGVPIINLSLGGYSTATALDAAISYASSRGTVIVAAAGNDQAAQLTWPAADPRVISVGAIDARAQQVTFSNSGPQLQVTAPGYGVQTAWLDGQRVYVDGTSASAPFVAGAIAAVMSQNPAYTAQQAWSVIRATTSDAGPPGADANYGAGVLNLEWAMNATNPTRMDPAIASHYYDSVNAQMNFVVQNRSAQTVRALAVDLDVNGSTQRYAVPEIAAGASYVLKIPVTAVQADASSALTYHSQLVTPVGMSDANVSNNQLTSRLQLGP